jgi:predicted nucleic acid-binding protein
VKTFIDTGGFIALYHANDHWHKAAKEVWRQLIDQNARLFTSNYVIAETLNLLRMRVGHAGCLRFGSDVFSSQAVKILRIAESHETKAWEIFKKYVAQGFSFTDCTSFSLMLDGGIPAAFAFDQHFRIIRFQTLPQ